MSESRPPLDHDIEINSDDFAEPHEHEQDYDGDFAQHPAVLDAFRLQAQLDHIVIEDTALFKHTIRTCLEHINDRLASKYDQPVTICAPATDILRANAYADLEDGEVSINSSVYAVTVDDDSDTPQRVTPPEDVADSLSGPFRGFSFLYEEIEDDEQDEDEEAGYRVNLYARILADEADTPLASATIFHAARLSRASITMDDDMLEHSLGVASDTLDKYHDTAIYEKLLTAESAIENSSFTLEHLKRIDAACRQLFAEANMTEEFPLQDNLIDLMKVSHSPDEDIEFTASVIVRLEHVNSVGRLSYFEPAQHDTRCSIEITSDLADYIFLPRTIVNTHGDYELSDETLGLYLAVDLADGHIGYIPVERLQDIA